MTTITLPAPGALGVEGTIGVWGTYRLTFNHDNQTASWEAALYALEPNDTWDYYLTPPTTNFTPPSAGLCYTTASTLHNRNGTITYEIGATYELPYVKKTRYSVFSQNPPPPALTTITGDTIPAGYYIYYNSQAYQQIDIQEFFVGFLPSIHIGTIPNGWGGTGGDPGGGDPGTTTYPVGLMLFDDGYILLDDPRLTEAEGLSKGYTLHAGVLYVFW